MTPDVAPQIKNESAAEVSVVNPGLANARVLNVSVGEDKTKALRQKKVLRMSSHHAQNSDTTYRRTTNTATRIARSKASNVKLRTLVDAGR